MFTLITLAMVALYFGALAVDATIHPVQEED